MQWHKDGKFLFYFIFSFKVFALLLSLSHYFFLLLLGCVGVFQSNDKKLHRP